MSRYLKGSLVSILLALSGFYGSSVVTAQETAFVSVELARDYPIRGQSRKSVRSRFGDPLKSRPAVGNPPISSWHFQDFTVYFEHNLVITSVAQKDSLPTKLEKIQ